MHRVSGNMKIVASLIRQLDRFKKEKIIKEQYPMLTPLSWKQQKKEGVIGVVYMLHHIIKKNPEGIPTNEDLKVTPDFLDKIITKYKKRNVDFISLDELSEIVISRRIPDRPFVVFTIDDGYLDNYTQALPVFEHHNVPFAIFVATDFLDKKAILWWDCIENLILTNSCITISDGTCYPCDTFQQRWDTFRILREKILTLDQNNLQKELKLLFSKYDIDWLEPIKKQGMSWEQVKTLAKHPLCTIGGHTVSHPPLSVLSEEKAKREIQEGIIKLEQAICHPVKYLAFPFGTPNEIGEREFQIVAELGIKLAFMAHVGCITDANISNYTHLPRFYFHET